MQARRRSAEVPKVRVYEEDLLDSDSKVKINHGVVIWIQLLGDLAMVHSWLLDLVWVRVYEVDLLDSDSKVKINHGVVIWIQLLGALAMVHSWLLDLVRSCGVIPDVA
ncbi:hypothetical protein RYX36_024933 [Vicia faba]